MSPGGREREETETLTPTLVVVPVEVPDLPDLLVARNLGGGVDPQPAAVRGVPCPTLVSLEALHLQNRPSSMRKKKRV